MTKQKSDKISENEVEQLVKQGKFDDDRVGKFILKVVGSHKRINNNTAKGFSLTYDELVNDGAFFVVKYIKNYSKKKARFSTYIYQGVESFLKNLRKKYFKVQRRIPLNKQHSFDKLSSKTTVVSMSTFLDYRSAEALFVRAINWMAIRLHEYEKKEIEYKIILKTLIEDCDALPEVKKVLELIYEGHDYSSIVEKIGKQKFERCKELVKENFEIFEDIGVPHEILQEERR